MGLLQFGITNAENPASNYNHAHMIVLNMLPPNLTDPKQPTAPLFMPPYLFVRQYMLTEPVQ